MRIEVNPRSLLNLENICEVLYKLHPSILDELVEIERSFGDILGFIDYGNVTLEQREFLANIAKEVDYSKKPEKPKETEKTKGDLLKKNKGFGRRQKQYSFSRAKKIYSNRY